MFTTACIKTKSGQSTQGVRKVVDEVCTHLGDCGLIVKYRCMDGDPGYNEYHRRFFIEWDSRFQRGQLADVIGDASQQPKFTVPDFLSLWMVFCNRVKNHRVTLSPDDCTDFAISADSLETLLKLGAARSDRSSIGRMKAPMLYTYSHWKTV
jgi:hypothetical protein